MSVIIFLFAILNIYQYNCIIYDADKVYTDELSLMFARTTENTTIKRLQSTMAVTNNEYRHFFFLLTLDMM